jgi:FkbM family methyltransferase
MAVMMVLSQTRSVMPSMWVRMRVGANIGYFSLAAAQVVGSTGHVLAVEPNAENVRLLLQSIAANHFQNIEVAQVAVSSKIETILLHATVGNGTTSKIGAGDNIGDATLVPAIPIDNLVSNRKQRINLIKIDVEGFEPIALSGAETVIKKDKPKLIFEFSATDLVGTTPQAFLQMLDDWGYQFTPVLEGADRNKTVTPSELIEIFEKHNSSHIDVLAEQA